MQLTRVNTLLQTYTVLKVLKQNYSKNDPQQNQSTYLPCTFVATALQKFVTTALAAAISDEFLEVLDVENICIMPMVLAAYLRGHEVMAFKLGTPLQNSSSDVCI